MTIIIDNIITPYEIARYNAINKVLNGNLEVWFRQKSIDGIRKSNLPEPDFKYRILNNGFFKIDIIYLLNRNKSKIKRVICCGWDSFVYLYAFCFCRINNIRFTLWSGSTFFEMTWQRKIIYPLVKFIVSRTDDYIAYGTRAKEYLLSLGAKKEKIKIFLNSVDVDYFYHNSEKIKKGKTKLKEKYLISTEDTIFLFVGQLIERKGIKELLSAFVIISDIIPSVTLLIAGKGRLGSWIEQFINEHPRIKIKLLGYIQYYKLPEIYSLSDVLVLPSKEEVWGLVVNEALASGIPVIVSNVAGSSADLIGENNGEIINEITESAILDAIKRYMQKKEYIISDYLLKKMKNDKYAKDVFGDI